ncbi:hypothetical protein ACMGDM_11415 [Sphingomonas sp. DT-51]|uniref:hypothetical protein n=1 Tax=Sphingomonas sp. DT-51 TaxID=3396165 RepID=UPI003F1BE26B
MAAPVDPCSDDSRTIVLKSLSCALLRIWSSQITVVGVGAEKPLDVIREPVTTTSGCTVDAPC